MWLVVGLGNPGSRYARTRHNVGWGVVERLASRWSAPDMREKLGGRFTKTRAGDEDVVLLEPLTFMNRSGESVQQAMRFFDVPLERVVVVHDELDLALGDVRVKSAGGAGGHNGLKSIIAPCGGPGFVRVRLGIGRPPVGTTESWVLGEFSAEESARVADVLEDAALATEVVVREGPDVAQNRFNRRDRASARDGDGG